MPNIVHRIGLDNVAPKEVYSALATIKGLAGWWTESVSGESKVGGILQFRFGEGGPDFEVLELHEPTRVCWRCVAGPSEWIDTHVQFGISTLDDETVLVFRHCGWRDEVEFMHHCSTQWAYFLIGLKRSLEGGRGSQFPNNESISRW